MADDLQRGGPGQAYQYVALEDLEQAALRVVVSPFETVFVHLIDALTGGGLARRVAPGRSAAAASAWRAATRSRLRGSDAETLRPLLDPRTLSWPSCLSSPPDTTSVSMEEALEEIAERSAGSLTDAILGDAGVERRAIDAWTPVLRDPVRWRDGYLGALHRAWSGFEPLWRRSAGLLDRELERVAAASARGATPQLLDALHPYSSIDGDRWRLFARRVPTRMRLSDGRLTVFPLLAEAVCVTDSDDAGALRSMSYPVAGAWRAFDGDAPPPASLEALIGPRRAAILWRLDRVVNAGDLAARLHLTPSGLTPHLQGLEAAGLVTRERRGRHVLVRRTARGTELLALYER